MCSELATKGARTIYIIQESDEPPPIIKVISRDMIPQYSNDHIVYPRKNDWLSQLKENEKVDLFDIKYRGQEWGIWHLA